MNILKQFAAIKLRHLSFAALPLLLLIGCSKESSKEIQGIKINLTGIQSLENNKLIEKNNVNKLASINSNNNENIFYVNDKKYAAILTTEDINKQPASTPYNQKIASTTTSSNTEILENIGYQFRLDQNSGGYYVYTFSELQMHSGYINLTAGNTHNWYALSFNSKETIPNIISQNYLISPNVKTELLYDAGQVTIGPSNPSVNILFKRKSAQLAIKFDATAINASIVKLRIKDQGNSTNKNYLYTGSLTIISGQVIPYATNTSTFLEFVDFKDVNPANPGQIMVGNYYTHSTSPLVDFQIKVEECVVKIGNDEIPLPLDLLTFPGTINPQLGKSTSLTVKIKELP